MKPSTPVRFHSGMASLDASAWNRLAGDYPFLRYEFLAALEDTGCVTPATGWTPHHLQIGSLHEPAGAGADVREGAFLGGVRV